MSNYLDTLASLFPCGQLGAAFSCAFFGFAGIVYLVTIYGHYHYAADGAASIVVSLFASLLLGMYEHLRQSHP